MANLTVILFLCATVPMLPALYMIPDKRSRLFLGYMLLGMVVCLIASEVNTALLGLFGGDAVYVSTNVAPIAEELMKALPVLFYSLYFSSNRESLISISYAVGIGFALGYVPGVGTVITALFMGPLITFFRQHLSDPLLNKGKTA